MDGTSTSGHICFYADDTDCRPRHCGRLMRWQQQMLRARVRRSSGFGEVAGPEVRRLDKLAWSRRCAMLMGSACSLWKLEHVCVTIFCCQGISTISQSHLTAEMIDLAPTISQAAAGRRKSAATTAPASLIAIGSFVQSPIGLAVESISKSGVWPWNLDCVKMI
jgi:hypothetical protein